MTSALKRQAREKSPLQLLVVSRMSGQQMGSQDGPLVDLWMAVVFSSKLGLVSKLFLNPVCQK